MSSWWRRWRRRRAWRTTPSWVIDLAFIAGGLAALLVVALLLAMVGGLDVGLHPGRSS